MKYAIIKTGGKQYKVIEGQTLQVEKLDNDGKTLTFSEVLLFVDGGKVEIGTPTVAGLTVSASVISDGKAKKIQVFKYKSKSRYRKLKGHRQPFTQVKIEAIGAKAAAPAAKKPAAKKSAVKKPAAKKSAAK